MNVSSTASFRTIGLLGALAFGLCRFMLAGIVACTVAPASAFAQDLPPAQKPAPGSGGGKGQSKRTTINFEDQLVEGQSAKPELFYLLQQRNNNFKRLIRLRENFLPEMRKTSEDVGRSSPGKGSN